MRWKHAVRARLHLLFRRSAEARMDEEMRFHLEMEAERLVREGMSPAEARRRAVLAFGGVEGHREVMREGRTLAWLGGLSLDLRLGLRMLAKHRGLTLVGGFAIAMAVAIGASFFEVVTELLDPALPVEGGDRVVALRYDRDGAGSPERGVLHDFVTWREELESVEQLGAFRTVQENLVTAAGPPLGIQVAEMTASGFALAGTAPLLGRYLVPDDEREGAVPVVVIGHEAWRARFAGDAAVVGRAIQLGAERHVVVGVMPEGFGFPVSHQYWTPLRVDPAATKPGEGPDVQVFGRLRTGISMEEAQAELATMRQRAATESPETHGRLRARVLPFTYEPLDGMEHPVVVRALLIFRFLVGGLMAVVAVNLAVLVYARTVARRGEIAVRSALGASRRRILAQLFAEALVLSTMGAVAGLMLSRFVLARGESIVSTVQDVPYWIDLDLSAGTLLYSLALAVIAAAVMGILPGMNVTSTRLGSHLRELGAGDGVRLGRVWTSLIVVQVAAAVAILPLAVFLVWQVARIEVADVGFPAEELVVGSVSLSQPAGGAAGEGDSVGVALVERQMELARRLAAEPGVTTVAFASAIPGIETTERRIEIEGSASVIETGSSMAGPTQVGSGFFEAYDAEIVAGRDFHAGEQGGAARSVVVNRTFANRFLGGRPALGQRLRYPGQADPTGPAEWHEIIGIVEDFPAVPLAIVRSGGVAKVYHPLVPGERVLIHARFAGGVPVDFPARFRAIGAAVDPEMQVRIRPLSEHYGSTRSAFRFAAWGISLVTLSVLLLSGAGIYALMSFIVAQRTREIGIRTALGADRRRIFASIFQRATRQLTLGALLGSLLSGALFSVAGFGAGLVLSLLAVVAAIMLAVGLLAALGPARRGLRIQPMEALRGDV